MIPTVLLYAAVLAALLPATERAGFLSGSEDGHFDKKTALIFLAPENLSSKGSPHLIVYDPIQQLEGIVPTKGMWTEYDGRVAAALRNREDIAFVASPSDLLIFSANQSIFRKFDGKFYRDVLKRSYICKFITGESVAKFVPTLEALKKSFSK